VIGNRKTNRTTPASIRGDMESKRERSLRKGRQTQANAKAWDAVRVEPLNWSRKR
jgi:hypothetical protein